MDPLLMRIDKNLGERVDEQIRLPHTSLGPRPAELSFRRIERKLFPQLGFNDVKGIATRREDEERSRYRGLDGKSAVIAATIGQQPLSRIIGIVGHEAAIFGLPTCRVFGIAASYRIRHDDPQQGSITECAGRRGSVQSVQVHGSVNNQTQMAIEPSRERPPNSHRRTANALILPPVAQPPAAKRSRDFAYLGSAGSH